MCSSNIGDYCAKNRYSLYCAKLNGLVLKEAIGEGIKRRALDQYVDIEQLRVFATLDILSWDINVQHTLRDVSTSLLILITGRLRILIWPIPQY